MDDFNDMNIVDTKEETDKKCPRCGGVMDFDPATGNLKCPYCDYEETISVEAEAPQKAEELDFETAEYTASKDWGVETKTVLCKACGAESIYDALQDTEEDVVGAPIYHRMEKAIFHYEKNNLTDFSKRMDTVIEYLKTEFREQSV